MQLTAENLATSVGRNTMFGMIASGARIVTRMLTVPVVVAYLGLEGYGIWAIILAVMTYMQIGMGGVRSAFQKYVAEATGTQNYTLASRLLSTGLVVVFAMYFLAFIPLVFYARPIVEMMGVPAHFILETASAIVLLFFSVNVNNVGSVFEAIVMGAHRIDIVRKLELFLLIAEASAMILLLLNGQGLLALTAVIAVSQILRTGYFFFKSRQILPQITIHPRYCTLTVVSELRRFAGSYQLLNVIAVLYLNVLPLVILKFFGAKTAGIYAICLRLVEAAAMAPEALLLPLLSGGTVVHYSKQFAERRRDFAEKAFKATLTLALPLLIFIVAFGEKIIFAWTGEQSELIVIGLVLLSLVYLCRAIAKVSFVLYRTIGGASRDVFWQLLRLGLLVPGVIVGQRVAGYAGVLAALVLAECVGMVFMVQVIRSTARNFFLGFKDSLKQSAKLMAVIFVAWLISYGLISVPISLRLAERTLMAIKLLAGFGLFALCSVSVLWLTNYFSKEERQVVTRSLALIFR